MIVVIIITDFSIFHYSYYTNLITLINIDSDRYNTHTFYGSSK